MVRFPPLAQVAAGRARAGAARLADTAARVACMGRREAARRAAELRSEIAFPDHRYYALDAPVIADEDYDRLRAELAAIERRWPDLITPDSPTQRVGGPHGPNSARSCTTRRC